MEIHNDLEMIAILTPIIEEAVDALAIRITNLVKSYIEKDVYGNGNIPHVYKRTEEFLDSWVKEIERKGITSEITAKIFSDARRMRYEPNLYIHGSKLSGDFREHLAEAIEEGLGYKFFPKIRKDGTWNPAAKKRKFYSDTIKELNKHGTLFKWFQAELAARGLTITQMSKLQILDMYIDKI